MRIKKKLIPICISLEKELVEKLDALADKTGLSRSSFYRQGLIQYHDFQNKMYSTEIMSK